MFKSPQTCKSFLSIILSLKNILNNALNITKIFTIFPIFRSRSSSMLSNASSTSSVGSTGAPPVIPPRKCDLQKQTGRSYNTQQDIQHNTTHRPTPVREERRVAQSTFYVDSGSLPASKSNVAGK